ncbi:TetR/AcrR family transcriptional regulator [Kitasatospora arboriphila]
MPQTPADPAVREHARHTDGKLSRERMLACALEIIDREGVEKLSMRRLARALDHDPMSLYRYAANKAALLDGVAETVLGQLTVDSADPDWAAQLRAVARDYRRSPSSTPTSYRSWSPAPWQPHWPCAHAAHCVRSKPFSPCSPAPASTAPARCTSTAPCSDS